MTGLVPWLASTLLAVVATACVSHATSPSRQSLGEPFALRAGESATIDGRLTIGFERVLSDSRCPMDAICVWAGDAVARVSLKADRSDAEARELHTAFGGSETSFLDFAITLKSLAPYPQSTRKIPPDDYVATLVVSSR